MIACLDVDYRSDCTVAAAACLDRWEDEQPCLELVDAEPGAAGPYVAGMFFMRELPHLERVLRKLRQRPSIVLIDGYAWLGPERAGLGAHLHHALGGQVPVIGVAKTRYEGAPALEVLRGGSKSPLHVTAAGMDPGAAADCVRKMSGPYRIPTLLRRVDQLCRRA